MLCLVETQGVIRNWTLSSQTVEFSSGGEVYYLFTSLHWLFRAHSIPLFVWLSKESWSSLRLMAPVESGIRSFQFSDSAWGTHPTLRLIGHLSRVKSLLAYPTLLLSTHFHLAPLHRVAERMLTGPGIILSSLPGVRPSLCGGSVWKTLQPQAVFWTVAACYCDVPSTCWQWVCSWTQTPDLQSRFSETCWSVTKLRSNTPYWLPYSNCGVRVFHSCFCSSLQQEFLASSFTFICCFPCTDLNIKRQRSLIPNQPTEITATV